MKLVTLLLYLWRLFALLVHALVPAVAVFLLTKNPDAFSVAARLAAVALSCLTAAGELEWRPLVRRFIIAFRYAAGRSVLQAVVGLLMLIPNNISNSPLPEQQASAYLIFIVAIGNFLASVLCFEWWCRQRSAYGHRYEHHSSQVDGAHRYDIEGNSDRDTDEDDIRKDFGTASSPPAAVDTAAPATDADVAVAE